VEVPSKVLPHPEFKVASGVQEVPLKSSMVGAGDDASARRMMYTGFARESGSS